MSGKYKKQKNTK